MYFGMAKPSQLSNERRSKHRVIAEGTAVPDCFQPRRRFSPPTRSYHVNKLRAQEWAASRQKQVYYAIAKDRISSRALQEKPDLGPRQGKIGLAATARSRLRSIVWGVTTLHWHACWPQTIWTATEEFCEAAQEQSLDGNWLRPSMVTQTTRDTFGTANRTVQGRTSFLEP